VYAVYKCNLDYKNRIQDLPPFSQDLMTMQKVLVTGATGKTGSLVLQKLRQRAARFEALGFARSPEKVRQRFGTTHGFHFGDIREAASLKPALQGCQALAILTSAIPQRVAPPQPGERPVFDFADGEMPEAIDWLGQKNQIDLAKENGIEHIVLVGSMGGRMKTIP
jgi:nucleoside-diphosphate-sugar epimerase